MSDLGPSARALLDAARGAGPDAAAIARMRGKIDLAITAGAATGAAKLGTSTGSTKAIATTLSVGTAQKLGLLALVIAAGAALLVAQRGSVDSSTSRPSRALGSPAAHAPQGAGPAAVHAATPGATATDNAASPTPRTAANPPARAANPGENAASPAAAVNAASPAPHTANAAASNAAPRAAAPVAAITLAREVELVDRAMLALRSGDAAGALAATRLHARETQQRGQLAEDATAIEIEALCTLRDPVAPRRLAAFDGKWPASAQRARLTKVCR